MGCFHACLPANTLLVGMWFIIPLETEIMELVDVLTFKMLIILSVQSVFQWPV